MASVVQRLRFEERSVRRQKAKSEQVRKRETANLRRALQLACRSLRTKHSTGMIWLFEDEELSRSIYRESGGNIYLFVETGQLCFQLQDGRYFPDLEQSVRNYGLKRILSALETAVANH